VSDPLLLEIGRRSVLPEHRDSAVPEGMKPGRRHSQTRQQRFEDTIADVVVAERRAIPAFEQQSPLALADVRSQHLRQSRVDVDLFLRRSRLRRQLVASPHTAPNANDTVFEIKIIQAKTKRLTDPHPRSGKYQEQDAITASGGLDDALELLLAEVRLPWALWLAKIDLPRLPDLATKDQFHEADDVEHSLAGQPIGLHERPVLPVSLELRRPQLRHEFLHRRLVHPAGFDASLMCAVDDLPGIRAGHEVGCARQR
jgi:hypothetical protein